MTTEDIIKLLPLEENEKIQLLNLYEKGNSSYKYSIDKIAWKSYFALYDEKLKQNIDEEMLKVQEGKEKADDQVYARAKAKTVKELTVDIHDDITKTDLAAARKAMEQIMAEIRAAKGSKQKNRNTN